VLALITSAPGDFGSVGAEPGSRLLACSTLLLSAAARKRIHGEALR